MSLSPRIPIGDERSPLRTSVSNFLWTDAPETVLACRSTDLKFLVWIVLAVISLGAGPACAVSSDLLTDGGFESGGLGNWSQCGGVEVADRPPGGPSSFASGNGKAVVLRNTSGSCLDFGFESWAFWHPITIPADATRLTVSFWHYLDHTTPTPVGEQLTGTVVLIRTTPGGADFAQSVVGQVYNTTPSGWNYAAFDMDRADLERLRGRNLYLKFSHNRTSRQPSIYLDSVRVDLTAPSLAKQDSVLPAELRSDGSRPLASVQVTPQGPQVVRLNTDGSDVRPIFAVGTYTLTGPSFATWSHDGTRIAVGEDGFQVEPTEFPTDQARINALHIISPDGESRRELFRTSGFALKPGEPRGCRFPRTDCIRQETNALDVLIPAWEWSPDDTRLLTLRCVNTRWSFSETDDATCTRVMRSALNGEELGELGRSTYLGNWGANNLLLFPGWLSGIPEPGLFTANPDAAPFSAERIYPHFSSILATDVVPLWLPDNRHFLTLRRAQSFLRKPDGSLSGWRYAFMRFDRSDLGNPQQVLYPDQIDQILAYDVSPDGRYVIYAAKDFGSRSDLWWLRLADGVTGRITTGANLTSVSWRRTGAATPLQQCSIGDPCDDGDACTVDRCDAGICAHTPVPGIAGARCVLAPLKNRATVCEAGESINKVLARKLVTSAKTLDALLRKADKASPKRKARLLARARIQISRLSASITAAQGRSKITEACARRTLAAIAVVGSGATNVP